LHVEAVDYEDAIDLSSVKAAPDLYEVDALFLRAPLRVKSHTVDVQLSACVFGVVNKTLR